MVARCWCWLFGHTYVKHFGPGGRRLPDVCWRCKKGWPS